MASIKRDRKGDEDYYIYEREYTKEDGTKSSTKQKIPKKKVLKRELIEKSHANNKYIYKYKTTYDDGEVKIITMTRNYKSKKLMN